MAKQEITFSYRGLYARYENPKQSWEKLLCPQAELHIFVGEKLFFREVHFDIGEFMTQIGNWAKEKMKDGTDFYYQAIESDQEKFFWIKKGDSGWKISSVFQEYPEDYEFSSDEILSSVNRFVEQVLSDVKQKFGIDLTEWLLEPFPY